MSQGSGFSRIPRLIGSFADLGKPKDESGIRVGEQFQAVIEPATDRPAVEPDRDECRWLPNPNCDVDAFEKLVFEKEEGRRRVKATVQCPVDRVGLTTSVETVSEEFSPAQRVTSRLLVKPSNVEWFRPTKRLWRAATTYGVSSSESTGWHG